MKYCKFLLLIGFAGILSSCGGDDDICDSGEGTPRMKIMFRTADNKITTLDSLQIFVDYGSGKVDLGWTTNVGSTLVPLRVDDSPFTEMYIKTTRKGDTAKVRMNYSTKASYVSPGCGVKKNYENLSAELVKPNPVTKVEIGQNSIDNEDKTSLYLVF